MNDTTPNDELTTDKKQAILKVIRQIREKIEEENPEIDESAKLEMVKEMLYQQTHHESNEPQESFHLNEYNYDKVNNIEFNKATILDDQTPYFDKFRYKTKTEFVFDSDKNIISCDKGGNIIKYDIPTQSSIHINDTQCTLRKYNEKYTIDINDNIIATGGLNRLVRLWDVRSPGKPINNLRGHSHTISSIRISPSSMLIYSSSFDKSIVVHDMRMQVYRDTWYGHAEPITDMDMCHYSDRNLNQVDKLVTCSHDSTIRVYRQGIDKQTIYASSGFQDSIKFLNQNYFVSSGLAGLSLYDSKKRNPVYSEFRTPIKTEKMWASAIGINYGHNVIAKFGVDKSLKVYAVESGTLVLKKDYGDVGLVTCAKFLDDKLVYTTGNSMRIGRWYTDKGAKSYLKYVNLY